MEKSFRAVQFAANVGIIILTLLVGFVVLRQYVFVSEQSEPSNNILPVANAVKPPAARPVRESLLGKVVPLEHVNWNGNETTLVLYLSTTCRFCNESAPFYQRLIKEKSNKQVKIVAAFTQSTEEARQYLKTHNISVDQVLTGSLKSIGASGTPTILLVNKDGVISDFWRGKLNPEKEVEVLAKLPG